MSDMYEEGLDNLSAANKCGKFAYSTPTPKCLVRNYTKNDFSNIGDLKLNRIMGKASRTNLFDLAGLYQFQ